MLYGSNWKVQPEGIKKYSMYFSKARIWLGWITALVSFTASTSFATAMTSPEDSLVNNRSLNSRLSTPSLWIAGVPSIWVGGSLIMKQGNGYIVECSINQIGQNLTGFCTHSNRRVRSTEAIGSVYGDTFDFTITWNNGTRGRYIGKLESGFFTSSYEGILKGTTYDLNNPNSNATWEVFDRVFQRP